MAKVGSPFNFFQIGVAISQPLWQSNNQWQTAQRKETKKLLTFFEASGNLTIDRHQKEMTMQTKTKRNLAVAIFAIGGISFMAGFNSEHGSEPKSEVQKIKDKAPATRTLTKKEKTGCRVLASWSKTADNLMRHQTTAAETRGHLNDNLPSRVTNMVMNVTQEMQRRGFSGGDLELAANNYCRDLRSEGAAIDDTAK